MSILFLRLGAGILVIYDAASIVSVPWQLAAVSVGLLLLAGLMTPISGVMAAIFELWIAFSRADDLRIALLLAMLGAALAMLGPGAWSVDAHLFGRKRIYIRDR